MTGGYDSNKYYHINVVGIVKAGADVFKLNTDNKNVISAIQNYTGFENGQYSSNSTAVEAEQYNYWLDLEIKFNSGDNTELMLVLNGGGQSPENIDGTAKKDIYITNFELVEKQLG